VAEDITVHPVGNRVLVTLVVVGTRNDDGSAVLNEYQEEIVFRSLAAAVLPVIG
jgi:hypothetical protein